MLTACPSPMRAGVAILGASVIAIAPMAVIQPDLPTIEAAPVDAIRSVTVDVELTALLDALIAAIPEVGQRFVDFATKTLPEAIQADIAAGHYAHLGAIAVAVAAGWPVIDALAPILGVLETELPPPLGSSNGAVVQLVRLTTVLPNLIGDLALEIAEVVDGVDQLGGLPADLFNAVVMRLDSAVTYLRDFIAAFGVPLPLANLELPEAPEQARVAATAAAADEAVAQSMPEAPPASISYSTADAASAPVSITVATSDPTASDTADAASPDDAPDAQESASDEKPGGATDLSDGNRVEPDALGDESGVGSESPTAETEQGPTGATASDDDAAGSQTDTAEGGQDGGDSEGGV